MRDLSWLDINVTNAFIASANFLNKSSLFITGGTGFFGRSLLRRIAQINQHSPLKSSAVSVLTRDPSSFLKKFPEFENEKWLVFRKGDVLRGLDALVDGGSNYTHVIHAAADSTLGPKMPLLDRFDQIVLGTRNTLDFSVKVNAKKFLLTSSGGIYGSQPSNMESFSETHLGMPDPLDPLNTYSVAKRLAEHLCCLYSEKYPLEVVIARCFAFVGPDLPLDVHFAIGNFIRDVLSGQSIEINGDGTPVRSYLYQDDLADWLLQLVNKGRSREAYNVGSDQALSILDLAKLVKSTLSSDVAIEVRDKSNGDISIRNKYIPNIDKISKELGVKINVPLMEAIQLTAKQHMSKQKPENNYV